ncbi:MAG: DUF6531 domain-containing protein, partial [Actinobacteria bacterium]|nr:DUF6531 domain-containing protein [Actinomycetota bacterium]
DGRTATNGVPPGTYYPFVGKAWESAPGRETVVGEVHLPLVPAGTLRPVSATEPTTITFVDEMLAQFPHLEGVEITVPADSLYHDDGTRGGQVGIAPVPPDRLPGRLPPGLEFAIVITVQTDGATNFDVPVPLRMPNLDGLPPGAKSALWSFNHDTGEFEVLGPMTVTADGLFVVTDPGVGILAPGWQGVQAGTQGSGGDIFRPIGPFPPIVRLPQPGGPQENPKDDAKSPGSPNSPCKVFFHSGEEHFDRVDLQIPGRGDIHFRLERRYRSRIEYDGPLGHNWDLSYGEGLFIEANGDVTRTNGKSHVDTWSRNGDGSYASPKGFFGTLIRDVDGTYVLRERDGFKRVFRADGRLLCHVDRFGNRMLFEHDHRGNLDFVVDPYGRQVDFVFRRFDDGQGGFADRLVRVVDFIGREVVYSYDERGDLVAVRTPVVVGTSTGNDFPQGRTERYAYSSGFADERLNHNILELTFPEEVAAGGPPVYVWTYGTDPSDPDTFDRVIQRVRGGTNASGVPAGGTETYAYEALNAGVPLGDPDVPRQKTTYTDRNGNVTEYFFNEQNVAIIVRRLTRGLRAGEPAFYETRSFYDEDAQLVREIAPEGNELLITYDRAGPRARHANVIEKRRVAGARGGGEDIVTTFTYEPLYNQVASITDPRGNATGFVPPLGAASAERYTTRFFFDYQESAEPVADAEKFGIDLSSIARGLGDLNGDGRTDQTAGNAVRTESPAVTLAAGSNEALRLGTTTQPIVVETRFNDRGQALAAINPEGNVVEARYFSERDPDGDGIATLSTFMGLSADPTGYLETRIVDSPRPSGRRTTPVPPAAIATSYGYDPVGNVVSIRNPRGVVTRT